MEAENPSTLVVQCFCYKTRTSQKEEGFPCRKLYHSDVQSATTIRTFIGMAKIQMVIRSISAGLAIINLPRSAQRRGVGKLMNENIHRVPCAERQAFCITTTSITAIIAVGIRNAITLSLYGKIQLYKAHPCRLCSESAISSECGIRSI